MADEKLTIDVIARDRASREFDRVGDAAVRAGKDFDKASKGAGHLQAEIDQATINLRELGREFDRTGDKALKKDIAKERRALSELTRIRKEMAGFAGDDAATGFAASFMARVGPVMARMPFGPTGLAVGAGIGAAAAPVLSATIAGAVTTGVAAGAVAAGIALAARDPRVKAEAAAVGSVLMSELTVAARPFVDETIAGLHIIGREVVGLRPELQATFGDAAKYVQPLATGVAGFIREMAPGIRKAVHEAKPLIDMLAVKLPSLGRTLGDVFEILASSAGESADAIAGVLSATEAALGGTAKMIDILAKIGPFVSGPLYALGDATSKDADAAGEAGKSNSAFAKALEEARRSSEGATVATRTYSEVLRDQADLLREQFNQVKSVEQANIDYQRAMDELTESVKENGTEMDANTEKGRANREALIRFAEAAVQTRDANLRNGVAASTAGAQFARQREEILRLAGQLGLTKAEVEALINTLLRIPNITRTVTIKYNTYGAPAAKPGQLLYEAKGGIVAAQHGMVTSSPTVLFGERQTGQEAFIPKLGISRQRGMALASQAAAWHGASVVPNERMGGGGFGPVSLNYSGGGSGLDDMFVKWLHSAIREGRLQLSAGGSRVAVG